ncbi:MAG: hypothetical protein ACM3IJ_04045 [Candidatus Levyibacteriota bacterium]
MEKVTQKHRLGCAVACTAAILGIKYQEALSLFPNGKERAKTEGFYCKDIIQALHSSGKEYKTKYVRGEIEAPLNSIIYVKKSPHYPAGHYLAYGKEGFMDPWMNFPYYPRLSGFRKVLPDTAQYVVLPRR